MNFTELGLSVSLAKTVASIGFTQPTEIQLKAIPVVLTKKDVMASAETGSGKTAAYALPLIQAIGHVSRTERDRKPQVLVLVPTRELAIQVQKEFVRFTSHMGIRSVTIYGGAGFEKQTRELKRGVEVIVATPGRLTDHIMRGNADLTAVTTLVLDEADRMLDMGFMPQVRKIVAKMPARTQTVMFSATINKSVEETAASFLTNPVRVSANSHRVEPKAIEQRVFQVQENDKEDLLLRLIGEQPENNSILVFAKTRRKVAKIRKHLCASNVLAEEIHGDVSQNKREKTLERYRRGEFSVLVATDVAARGLDIPAISHVVNYDLPTCAQDYVHRIGRTGRAGRSGIALSFVTSSERHLMRDIEKVTGRRLDVEKSQSRALEQESESSVMPLNVGETANKHRHKPRRRFSTVAR